MTRLRSTALLLAGLVMAAPLARAEDPAAPPKSDQAANQPAAKKPDPIPPLATAEEAKAAIDAFKEAWKARGLSGDDRLGQRDFALQQLAPVQHVDVADEILRVARGPDADLRIAALVHLTRQRALPVYVGKRVAEAMARSKNDVPFIITCLETIGALRYLGASEQIEALLRHPDYSVKKAAIAAVGDTGDFRLLGAMLKQVGIDANRENEDGQSYNQSESEEGYSWDGAEASVDTGTAGDGDQKAAEAKATKEAADNKAKADAANAASGGTSTGRPSGMGGGGGGRSPKELIHPIKASLAKLTGEDFDSSATVRKWCFENREKLVDLAAKVLGAQKAQAEAEKQALKAAS